MAISKYQQKLLKEKAKKALKLYKQGMTMREVGAIVGRSRTWVWLVGTGEVIHSLDT